MIAPMKKTVKPATSKASGPRTVRLLAAEATVDGAEEKDEKSEVARPRKDVAGAMAEG